MTPLFWALYVPVIIAIVLIAWVVNKLADKIEALITRCDAIETVDDFEGAIRWPVEPDDFLLDGLRDEAGDEDDTKRRQLEAVVRMGERRH